MTEINLPWWLAYYAGSASAIRICLGAVAAFFFVISIAGAADATSPSQNRAVTIAFFWALGLFALTALLPSGLTAIRMYQGF